MKRQCNLYLESSSISRLDVLADALGTSRAEIVERLLALYELHAQVSADSFSELLLPSASDTARETLDHFARLGPLCRTARAPADPEPEPSDIEAVMRSQGRPFPLVVPPAPEPVAHTPSEGANRQTFYVIDAA